MRMGQFAGLRQFSQIWAGQLISGIGSRLSSFALGMWILRTTGSTAQFAFTFIAMEIPSLIIAPFAGALIDRWDRRHVMLTCSLLSATIMLIIASLLASAHLVIWHIYIAVALAALCDSFYSPAFWASIPLLATREQLPRVNGMVQTGNAVAGIFGPLLAGVLVSTISLYGVFVIDAVTFLFAASALLISRIPRPVRGTSKESSSLLQEALIGWRYVQQRSGLLGLLALNGVNSFVFAVAGVLITPLLMSFTDPTMVGIQYAIGGGGLLLGGVAVSALGIPRKRIHGIAVFSLLGGLCLALHGLWPSFTLVATAGFVLFAMLPFIAVASKALWQTKVPADLQGRCSAIQQVVSNSVTPIGYGLAGPLSEYVFQPLLASGGLLAGSVGLLIGVGPGRGIGLMFILLGVAMMLVAAVAYMVPAIRNVDALPDVFAMTESAELAVPSTGLRDATI